MRAIAIAMLVARFMSSSWTDFRRFALVAAVPRRCFGLVFFAVNRSSSSDMSRLVSRSWICPHTLSSSTSSCAFQCSFLRRSASFFFFTTLRGDFFFWQGGERCHA